MKKSSNIGDSKIKTLLSSMDPAMRNLGLHLMAGMDYLDCVDILFTMDNSQGSGSSKVEFALRSLFDLPMADPESNKPKSWYLDVRPLHPVARAPKISRYVVVACIIWQSHDQEDINPFWNLPIGR